MRVKLSKMSHWPQISRRYLCIFSTNLTCIHLTIFFSSEEDEDDVDITEAELNALPFSDQEDDSDQDIDIEEEDENNDFLSQYAEAGCYPQKS